MKKCGILLLACCVFVFGAAVNAADMTGGEKLYKSCAGCHGKDGQTMALGVGKALKGQPANVILDKLNGYADGTYGGSKKKIMTNIIKRMSQEDRVKVSEYISTFK